MKSDKDIHTTSAALQRYASFSQCELNNEDERKGEGKKNKRNSRVRTMKKSELLCEPNELSREGEENTNQEKKDEERKSYLKKKTLRSPRCLCVCECVTV